MQTLYPEGPGDCLIHNSFDTLPTLVQQPEWLQSCKTLQYLAHSHVFQCNQLPPVVNH